MNINSDESKRKVRVDFLGDTTFAFVPIDKVEDFNHKFEEFGRRTGKKLKEAITIAKSIISGETQPEDILELRKNEQKKEPRSCSDLLSEVEASESSLFLERFVLSRQAVTKVKI